MYNDGNRQLAFINYETFFSIAWKAFFQVQKLLKIRGEKEVVTDKDIDKVCMCNADIQRLSIISIILCTMTLEAYINKYGATHLSRSYFDHYLDKLDIKSKWIIIPRLVTGNQIQTNSKAFKYLVNLISLRNKLVHVKLNEENIKNPKSNNWLWEDDTFDTLECVKLLLAELKKIDNTVEIDWIENTKNDPYA